jgi:predicted naringenin-chalcone synthase
MTVNVLSIGTALPRGRMAQEVAAATARSFAPHCVPEGVIEVLHRRTGIRGRAGVIVDPATGTQNLYQPDEGGRGPSTARRLSLYTKAAGELACESAGKALGQAGIEAARVTHVVTVSCTGFEAPGVDQLLVKGLSLPANVGRTHIGFMGCHGALNGLAVARAIAASDPAAIVLLCCVELCSLHMHYGDRRDQLIANALFADGAAAVVVSQHPSPGAIELRACASRLFDATADLMGWRIGDHGFEMSLAHEVPDVLAAHVPAWIDSVLESCKLKRSAVGAWAIHPGGPKIVESVVRSLGLEKEAADDSLAVFREHGNMSSPTVLFILQSMMTQNRARPWVAMAFGPGLAAEAVVLLDSTNQESQA